MEKGIVMLRKRMKKAGVVLSVVALTSMLSTVFASAAAPTTLSASIAKMAISADVKDKSSLPDTKADITVAPEVDRIYQYFAPSEVKGVRKNLGAYLWIPPNTPKIRAVMVGMHNGLPINILQSAPMREVCRKHGIAQVLFTPWAKDIGEIVKGLQFDISDPKRTAIYDGYMKRLAEMSGHPELLTAPTVPLAHSAYASFPYEVAMRNSKQCLAAIPIKAGMPCAYEFMAKHPDKGYNLNYVPILFIHSSSQETVNLGKYPISYSTSMRNYRNGDTDDNPGTTPKAHADLYGSSWEMMTGHFDMLPRAYRFTADWLDAIATARLPKKAGAPLKNINLKDGWLMNPRIPAAGDLPENYAMPAPYLKYKDRRQWALWYPNEKLAKYQFELGMTEPRKKIEMITFLNSDGKPISLAHSRGAKLFEPNILLHDDGILTLTTKHYTKPPEICTVKDRKHVKLPDAEHKLENVAFPGKTAMPVSKIPLKFDANSGSLKLISTETFKDERGVTETKLNLKLICHRIAPNANTRYTTSFVRVFHQGDEEFAATGRTCNIGLVPHLAPVLKNAKPQTIEFPAISDISLNKAKANLKAKSSEGLPVDYFVLKGPGIIKGNKFILREVPVGFKKPIEVTIGAYQVGLYKKEGGVKPAKTVYQAFKILPKKEK